MGERESAEWLARRLASARADAVRIARELTAQGYLSEPEARTLEAAVTSAVERGRDLLARALREPARALRPWREASGSATAAPAGAGATAASAGDGGTRAPAGAADADALDLASRLLGLEERLVRLEHALADLRQPAATPDRRRDQPR